MIVQGLLEHFDSLYNLFRFSVSLVCYLWAVLLLFLTYLGDFFELEFDNADANMPGRREELRNMYTCIVKILMVVLTSSAASAYPTDRAPATVHYMNLNPTSGAYA